MVLGTRGRAPPNALAQGPPSRSSSSGNSITVGNHQPGGNGPADRYGGDRLSGSAHRHTQFSPGRRLPGRRTADGCVGLEDPVPQAQPQRRHPGLGTFSRVPGRPWFVSTSARKTNGRGARRGPTTPGGGGGSFQGPDTPTCSRRCARGTPNARSSALEDLLAPLAAQTLASVQARNSRDARSTTFNTEAGDRRQSPGTGHTPTTPATRRSRTDLGPVIGRPAPVS